MNEEIENGILGNLDVTEKNFSDPTSEVNPQDVLESKHNDFRIELEALCNSYGVNMLYAANYITENQTIREYIGQSNLMIELGLQKSIEQMR